MTDENRINIATAFYICLYILLRQFFKFEVRSKNLRE